MIKSDVCKSCLFFPSEQIMAEMHLENYSPKTEEEQGPDDCSRFLASLQTAIEAIRKNHFNRFPQNSDFVLRSFKWLAGR